TCRGGGWRRGFAVPGRGCPGCTARLTTRGTSPRAPPEAWLAAVPRGGAAAQKPILSDGGLRGDDGLAHWAHAYGVQVCPRPTTAPRAHRRWLRSARQVVETTLAHVRESCGLTYLGTHSTWGRLRRVAAKVAASHLGMLLNRLLGRRDFAFATLIV